MIFLSTFVKNGREKSIFSNLKMNMGREVVDLRNVGKFLQKFFENQRLFQWLFVKRTKISDKNLNIWNFSDFLKKLKIFVNKNTIKMKNIKVPPYQRLFSVTFQRLFEKFLQKWKCRLPPWFMKAIEESRKIVQKN